MLSVVIPVYRNAETIEELYQRLRQALEPRPFELIFVNDACPAGSANVLEQVAAADSRVRLITHLRNQGQHRAVRRGLAEARGEILLTMDGDLQDPPEAIPRLLEALEEGGSAVVFAGRRGEYQAASRMMTSRAFKRLMHTVCGVPADAGSFVVMRREVAGELLRFPVKRPYMLALIGSAGFPMTSIAVARDSRPRGESAYSEWARISLAWNGLAAALWLKWWKWTSRQSNGTTRHNANTTAGT
ncbi:MAG: glycosyltransferase family 2 protein [Bryobacteraceae bacterium]